MQPAGAELDLMPLEIAQLRGPQTMPVSDQDHRCIPVTIPAVLPSCSHEGLDLGCRQILAGAN
jgi:hypothetical protein